MLIDHYGLSPSHYSVFFSINAVAFIGMSQLTAGSAAVSACAASCAPPSSAMPPRWCCSAIVVAAGIDRLDVLGAMLFVGYGFLGLVMPE